MSAFDDGIKTSTEIQIHVMDLLEQGLEAKAIAVAICGVGTALVIHKYGSADGDDICRGLINDAIRGKLKLTPALIVANTNTKE